MMTLALDGQLDLSNRPNNDNRPLLAAQQADAAVINQREGLAVPFHLRGCGRA